ncbi:MAG: hypothetical protein PHX43_03685 [Alphaproteobacteria bacterium]|nr:hypothetical protein [Alphaproteobacteria bacterium]
MSDLAFELKVFVRRKNLEHFRAAKVILERYMNAGDGSLLKSEIEKRCPEFGDLINCLIAPSRGSSNPVVEIVQKQKSDETEFIICANIMTSAVLMRAEAMIPREFKSARLIKPVSPYAR